MTDISRRSFNAILGSVLALGAASLPLGSLFAQRKANVVIVGGGFGGATAAKYLKLFNANLSVTLIEPSTSYMTRSPTRSSAASTRWSISPRTTMP